MINPLQFLRDQICRRIRCLFYEDCEDEEPENAKAPIVLFYEWSDLERVPVKYSDRFEFLRWCIENGVDVSDEDIDDITESTDDIIYASCKRGTPKLVFSNNQDFLRARL